MFLKEYTLEELISEFPDVTELDFERFKNQNFDFYINALGFEERTLGIPEELSKIDGFTCDELIYLIYGTSTNDNAFNEPRLKRALKKIKNSKRISAHVYSMFCDEESFGQILYDKIKAKVELKGFENVNLILDISVFSSKLILTLFKIIFEIKKINLFLVYAEAKIYFPLYEEFIKDPIRFLENESLSSTKGIETIVNSNEYSEGTKESPDIVIAFASFKAGRIEKIISDIDESILINNNERLIWLIGDPNFSSVKEREERKKMLRYINRIDDNDENVQYEVNTLNYKEVLLRLEAIYKPASVKFHFNIADLGSKMQTVAISIFYHIRPDVSVYYAIPSQYNSNRYSEGIKKYWMINFKEINYFLNLINKIDQLRIVYTPNKYPALNDPALEIQ